MNTTKSHCQPVEEQKVELGPASRDEEDSITTVLEGLIPNEVESKVTNGLEGVLDTGEEAVDQLFRTSPIIVQEESIPWWRKTCNH